MITIKKLTDHRYSQCHVEIMPNGNVHFFSYVTLVCSIEGGWLSCSGTYSQTTRKQIGWFLKEYAPLMNYHNAKFCYQNDCRINIHTGEIGA